MEITGPIPPVIITKFNRFADNIIERMNGVLRKNYDPVNVKLHSNSGNNTSNNNNKNKSGGKKKPGSRRNPNGHRRKFHITFRNINSNFTRNEEPLVASVMALSEQLKNTNINETLAINVTDTLNSRASAVQKKKTQHPVHKGNNNQKNKTQTRRPPTRATLYGLSTIKRDGDVTVNMMSSHTTVKSRFTLGPLMLKVEKEVGRGAKKDIRSAVATTTEMTGKLNLRVMNGGAATLHSIRVMQPKQVRVESSDENDKTREFVWRRSSHIAHLVSQKLTKATRSMLKPPPSRKTVE